jgi:putative lipoprotein
VHPVLLSPAFRHVDVILARRPLQEATLNASVPLRQTYWKLIELVDGADLAAPADGADAAHLVLARDSDRAMGSGGCNRFAARYQVDGGQLRFDALVSGLRLCLQGGTSELAYLERLDAVRAYWQQGRSLELRDRAGKPVLRFVAEERGEPPPDDDEPPLQPS